MGQRRTLPSPPAMNIRLKKCAIVCHRWMGVGFCVLFSWWFVSGIFMMYWDYPGVGPEERQAHAAPLDPSRIRVSPQQAYAGMDLDRPADQVRLGMFAGRPAYWFRFGRGENMVYADDGQAPFDFPPEVTLRVASEWTGQPARAARLEINTTEDQWTVAGSFKALRPLDKYSWPDGQQVYVSEATGEVAQYTTRGSRLGAYLGPIPHWMYFTPLRKNQALWTNLVTWAAGIATVTSIFGLIVGIWMYSPSKRYRLAGDPTSIPYTGQKRRHTILGLFFGLMACTWAFSGMLSMEPFPSITGTTRGGGRIAGALRGGKLDLAAFAAKDPRQALAQAGSDFKVKELNLMSFLGEPVYLAVDGQRRSRIIPVHGEPMMEFDRGRIIAAVTKAVQPNGLAEARLVTEYDAYYLDRHNELPLPAILVRLNDAGNTRYYIDPRTARIVGNYNSGAWVTRWLYHGLHSVNFPWLYNYRPAWDIVVLALMLGGAWLSVTSLIIGFQLLRRKLA